MMVANQYRLLDQGRCSRVKVPYALAAAGRLLDEKEYDKRAENLMGIFLFRE